MLLYRFEKQEILFLHPLSLSTLKIRVPKHYRLWSLSNTDYEIIAFVLQKNICGKVSNKLESKDQSTFRKGRFIGTNARLVKDIYKHFMENDSEGLLLFSYF